MLFLQEGKQQGLPGFPVCQLAGFLSQKVQKIQLLFGVLLLLELCLNSCGFSLIDREEALEVPGAGAEAPVPEEAAPKEESSQAEPRRRRRIKA